VLRSIEALSRRSKNQVQNLDQLQKLGILYEKSKVESKTSKIGFIFV